MRPDLVIPADERSVHWGFFDASLPPVARVPVDTPFSVETVSSILPGQGPQDGVDPRMAELARAHEGRKGIGGHFLTGPLWVEGAESGGLLEVQLTRVTMTWPYAFQKVHPLWGVLRDTVLEEEFTLVPLDLRQQTATLTSGLSVPCHPFFGILGVAPPPQWGRIATYEPRVHGGNMDNRELGAGSRVFLPVHVPGGLLSIGDGHALQGDGEVCSTALETGLTGEFIVRNHPGVPGVQWPFAVTSTHLLTMAFHASLDEAAMAAVARMVYLLDLLRGVPMLDAYRICSVLADLRATQVVNREKGMHCMVELSVLDALGAPSATYEEFFPAEAVGVQGAGDGCSR